MKKKFVSAVKTPSTPSLTLFGNVLRATIFVSALLFISNVGFSQEGWIKQASGTSANLYGVSFANIKKGIVVGDSGIILRTTNGGADWLRATSGTSRPLYAVDFINRGMAT